MLENMQDLRGQHAHDDESEQYRREGRDGGEERHDCGGILGLMTHGVYTEMGIYKQGEKREKREKRTKEDGRERRKNKNRLEADTEQIPFSTGHVLENTAHASRANQGVHNQPHRRPYAGSGNFSRDGRRS
jgi:hypothetical protein